jgi:ABC-type iron transport system FetAB ATPase subunit
MTLYFTNEEQEQYEASLREVHFHSKLGFLNAHNGLRRGSLHMVIGTTGGGKSTLTRTLLRDIIFNKDNKCQVGLWLSEETLDDYKKQLAYGVPSHERLLSTEAISELESTNVSKFSFIEWLEMTKPDICIFDNITTSKLYMDKRPAEQAELATQIKNITKKLNIAMVLIAHTDANVTDSQRGLINLNQIRGSKSICNLVEFAYILQRFEIGQAYFPTVRVVKSRSQELLHSLYHLKYDPRLRAFSGDSALDFEQFKEAYGKRNRLD